MSAIVVTGRGLPSTVMKTDQANTVSTGAQSFAAATSLLVPTSAGFAPTADSSIGYDSTQEKYVAGGGGGAYAGSFPRVIAAGVGTQTLTNSVATDQDFTAIHTLAANSLFTNKILRVTYLIEIITGATTVTYTYYLKLGSTKIFTSPSGDLTNSLTRSFVYQFFIFGRSAVGAAASISCAPLATANNFSTGANTVDQPVGGIDTTGTLAITPGVTYSATTATESSELQAWMVEELN